MSLFLSPLAEESRGLISLETELVPASSCFPVRVPVAGGFSSATAIWIGLAGSWSGRGKAGRARKMSIFPPAAVFIDSL